MHYIYTLSSFVLEILTPIVDGGDDTIDAKIKRSILTAKLVTCYTSGQIIARADDMYNDEPFGVYWRNFCNIDKALPQHQPVPLDTILSKSALKRFRDGIRRLPFMTELLDPKVPLVCTTTNENVRNFVWVKYNGDVPTTIVEITVNRVKGVVFFVVGTYTGVLPGSNSGATIRWFIYNPNGILFLVATDVMLQGRSFMRFIDDMLSVKPMKTWIRLLDYSPAA